MEAVLHNSKGCTMGVTLARMGGACLGKPDQTRLTLNTPGVRAGILARTTSVTIRAPAGLAPYVMNSSETCSSA
jgi:hypothetical protein